MGFGFSGPAQPANRRGGKPAARPRKLSLDLLHRLECKACPLNASDALHPKIPAAGSKSPLIYVLGEAPGAEEDRHKSHFIGAAGEHLRRALFDIAGADESDVRWNNVIRTRPPKNRDPDEVEIECCRPSIIKDIEQHKPKAIFGFGNVPLKWMLGDTGIQHKWRGRRVPVKVGKHECWFYPMVHPSAVVRMKQRNYGNTDVTSELDRMFQLDLKRAVKEVYSSKTPVAAPHTPAIAMEGLSWVTGRAPGDLQTVLDKLKWFAKQEFVGYDYETRNIRPYLPTSSICTVALSTGDESFAFPIDHPEAGWSPAQKETINAALTVFLEDPHPRKLVHSLGFEMEWTAVKYGRRLIRAGRWEDTMSQAVILDERMGGNKPGCLSLDFQVIENFGFSLKKLSNLNVKKIWTEPVVKVLRYNALDAKYHCLLYKRLDARLTKVKMQHLYQLKLRQKPTAILTQIKGVPVDLKEVNRLHKLYTGRLETTLAKIRDSDSAKAFRRATMEDFVPSKDEHIKLLLMKFEGIDPELFKNQDGDFTTDEDHLSKMDSDIAKMIVEWRGYAKIDSTYVIPLLPESGNLYKGNLLHALLNTTFAVTGRTSSEDPNIQNFPKREHKEIRNQIKDPRGRIFFAVDYGQIEARVIAMASKDKAFVKALWEKYDVHMEWAERLAYAYPRRIGGKKMLKDKEAMKAFRADVKNQWTFPLFFGATLDRASQELKIPAEAITAEYDKFWEVFEGVHTWQEDLMKSYKKTGYVETLTGRRIRGPLSRNQLFNYPIQGAAADIALDGMNRLSEREVWDLQPNMFLHDDLTFVFDENKLDDYAEIIIDEMLTVPFDFVNVPISVECSIGPSWGQLEEVEKYFSNEWNRKQHV